METNQNPSPIHNPQQDNSNFMQSNTARIIMVGLLTLAMLIPLQYVKSLIWEREELQQTVTDGLAAQWGGNVYFYGPVLKVPYSVITTTEITNKKTGQVTVQQSAATDYAYFFPDALNADATVDTKVKQRGNYETTVFDSHMKFKGKYGTPNFATQGIRPENIRWDRASILINTKNLKSIKGAVAISLNGTSYNFEPVAKAEGNDTLSTLETTPINLTGTDVANMAFNLDVNYSGTGRISIVPIGKLTEVNMKSNWPSPGFTGQFSPYTNTVTDKGFTASWKVSHLNRPFVQQYFTTLPDLQQFAFSTDFLIPVDEYQQNERAAKYGFLVIGLTFLVFFLIQAISKIAIHIFQYGMIGLALVMFYTLLISITEHSSFMAAYLIAGSAVVIMIGTYSVSILKNKKFPAFIAATLTALYTFIYVIIQLENYALLAGSIGLFVILGAVMYISRKIDWSKNTATT